MDNFKNIFLSGFIAFTIYFSLFFLFFLYIKTADAKKIDSSIKTTVLQLDVILEDPNEEIKKISIEKNTIKDISQEIVKKSKSVSIKERTDLKSLFANVDVKSKKVTKQNVANVKKSSIASRYKSKFEKDKKRKKISIDSLKKMENIKSVTQQSNVESKYDEDPYYSKIHAMISARWNPVVFYKDQNAKVIITISNKGIFSYEFVQYSDNIGFDTQLKNFLNKEKLKYYPINPNNKSTKIEIIFKAKGE
jgi:hypothetical protein